MAIYLVTPISDPISLAREVKERVSTGDFYFLPGKSGSVFVSFKGTTKELSDMLGITANQDERVSTGVVLPVTNYYGRGPTDMWEWIKVRMEGS